MDFGSIAVQGLFPYSKVCTCGVRTEHCWAPTRFINLVFIRCVLKAIKKIINKQRLNDVPILKYGRQICLWQCPAFGPTTGQDKLSNVLQIAGGGEA